MSQEITSHDSCEINSQATTEIWQGEDEVIEIPREEFNKLVRTKATGDHKGRWLERRRNERSRSRDRDEMLRRSISIREGAPERYAESSARVPDISRGLSESTTRDRGKGGRDEGRRSHKGKGFRLQSKHFCITYPKCEVARTEFDREFKLRHTGVEEYQSAREQHKDGSYHIHVYVRYSKRLDVCNTRYFDIEFEGRGYHPNIQGCKNRGKWLEYIAKGTDTSVDVGRITDVSINEFNPLLEKLGTRRKLWDDYQWSLEFRDDLLAKPVTWPIELHTEGKTYRMDKPKKDEDGNWEKKRSWWIKAEPNAGKTRWINKTFKGVRIYSPRMGKYPYEGFNNAEIIVYDDRNDVTFQEFSEVINVHDYKKPIYGEVRFKREYWVIGEVRTVIVLSNKVMEEMYEGTELSAMRTRFIQIVDPKLKSDKEIEKDKLEEMEEEELRNIEERKEIEEGEIEERKVDDGMTDEEREYHERTNAMRNNWNASDFAK